jgi:hypothetical protein
MDSIFIVLILLTLTLSLALLANRTRARYQPEFELKPNCLLTRWPLLFVSGQRSIFYFSAYWNVYTSFLAEHGYEVYNLHLPWSNSQRRLERLAQFLEAQEKAHRHYHLFMDQATMEEFKDYLYQRRSSATQSLSEISDLTSDKKKPDTRLSALPIKSAVIECPTSKKAPLLLKIAYFLHKFLLKSFFNRNHLPNSSTLGAPSPVSMSNCHRLLERAQTLAEMDLRAEA